MKTGKLGDKLCLTRRQSGVYIAQKEKGEIRDGFRNIVIKSYSNKVREKKGLKSGKNRKGEGQLTRSPIAAKVT